MFLTQSLEDLLFSPKDRLGTQDPGCAALLFRDVDTIPSLSLCCIPLLVVHSLQEEFHFTYGTFVYATVCHCLLHLRASQQLRDAMNECNERTYISRDWALLSYGDLPAPHLSRALWYINASLVRLSLKFAIANSLFYSTRSHAVLSDPANIHTRHKQVRSSITKKGEKNKPKRPFTGF